ncbi:MAG: hypothetical protein ACU84Q_00340 [Gammaproteobacteria bacterium]
MSKVTVDAYFHGKDDIFCHTAEHIGVRVKQAVDLARQVDGSPQQRIIAVL